MFEARCTRSVDGQVRGSSRAPAQTILSLAPRLETRRPAHRFVPDAGSPALGIRRWESGAGTRSSTRSHFACGKVRGRHASVGRGPSRFNGPSTFEREERAQWSNDSREQTLRPHDRLDVVVSVGRLLGQAVFDAFVVVNARE